MVNAVMLRSPRTFATDYLTDFKGKEHVEEERYIRRDEKERLHKRRIELEADIRNILTASGDTLTQDTVMDLANKMLADELRNA